VRIATARSIIIYTCAVLLARKLINMRLLYLLVPWDKHRLLTSLARIESRTKELLFDLRLLLVLESGRVVVHLLLLLRRSQRFPTSFPLCAIY